MTKCDTCEHDETSIFDKPCKNCIYNDPNLKNNYKPKNQIIKQASEVETVQK